MPRKPNPPAENSHSADTSETMRLQRFLAKCGLGARRKCEELITSGRVSIDGTPVTELGTVVNPHTQSVEVDTVRIKSEKPVYYLLNKPKGVVCTNDDPEGRLRVVDLFPSRGPRLFPVGRLDEESEGLILVTNDGEFSHRLAHPKFRIYRTYHVHVTGKPTKEVYEQLKKGIYFTEGKFRVHDISRIRSQGNSTHVKIILSEGKNREIRRLLARMGHKVMRLRRIGFGPVHLGDVKSGQYRPLTKDEIELLMSIVDRNEREKGYTPPRPAGQSNRGRRQGGARSSNDSSSRQSSGRKPRRPDAESSEKRGTQGVRFVAKPRVVVFDDQPASGGSSEKTETQRSSRSSENRGRKPAGGPRGPRRQGGPSSERTRQQGSRKPVGGGRQSRRPSK